MILGADVLRASCLLATLLAANPAAAQVSVRYGSPERFTDAQNRFGSGPTLATTLAEMTRLLETLGRRHLGPNESLAFTILDIDLAGFERPSASAPHGLRVVDDITPPRIRLDYVLRRGKRILAQGEETITDINFLLRANARSSTGGLYYERILLQEWLAKRFPLKPGAD